MSENDNETDTEKMNPVALAYDDIDDELIAKLYTLEIVAECKDLWWVRVEHLD